jgi:hypothetical protein
MKTQCFALCTTLVTVASALEPGGKTAAEGVTVTVENFKRAESDIYFAGAIKSNDCFGQFGHNRIPTPINAQTVIRMNRDTLYSAAVLDLDAGPVTITLPEANGRFMSMQVINQDHYTPMVVYGGKHVLTREAIGTRYVIAALRTLVNPADPKDVQQVHALQDAVKVEQPGSPGKFEIPRWEPGSHKQVRDALILLGGTLPDTKGAFGRREEVDPIRHLLCSATAWGGNPERDALYLTVTPKQNDGTAVHRLTVKNVPVDGFWSVSVYNAEGYFEKNAANAYSLNNLTATPGNDGSVTIQFGGDPKVTPNCLPIVKGWNYTVRLYRPRPEVLNGTWKFPEAQPVE